MNHRSLNRNLAIAFALVTQLGFVPLMPAEHISAISGLETNNVYPIDLPTALRLANAQNLDIQIAQQRLSEAEANRDSATERFFPWIAPGIAYQRHRGKVQAVDGTMLDADKQSYELGGSLTARLSIGDAIYSSLAARQVAKASDQALEAQRRDATLAAATGYFELARAKALQEVVNDALNISREYQTQLQAAVEAGIAFKGDELRVQAQTERYRVLARQAAERQRLASARLAQTLHLEAGVELVPQGPELAPMTLVETDRSLRALVQQALESRPELKQNEAEVKAAQALKNGAVYGPLVPSIGAQAFAGGLGGGPGDSTGNFGQTQDYFVGLDWRIGPGGLFDFGRVRASKARLETARLGVEKTRDEIIRQVVEGHTRAQSLLDQIATDRQNLATTAETLRLTRERKQYGVGVVLEDIQAQQEVTRARSDFLNAVTDYNQAQYELNRAIGPAPGR